MSVETTPPTSVSITQESTVMCLRQAFKPERSQPTSDVGDCNTCVTHQHNKWCKLYTPVTISHYDVTD